MSLVVIVLVALIVERLLPERAYLAECKVCGRVSTMRFHHPSCPLD